MDIGFFSFFFPVLRGDGADWKFCRGVVRNVDAVGKMELDMMIQDWIVVEQNCKDDGSGSFVQWLRGQKGGVAFGKSAGTKEVISFLMRHVEGEL